MSVNKLPITLYLNWHYRNNKQLDNTIEQYNLPSDYFEGIDDVIQSIDRFPKEQFLTEILHSKYIMNRLSLALNWDYRNDIQSYNIIKQYDL